METEATKRFDAVYRRLSARETQRPLEPYEEYLVEAADQEDDESLQDEDKELLVAVVENARVRARVMDMALYAVLLTEFRTAGTTVEESVQEFFGFDKEE